LKLIINRLRHISENWKDSTTLRYIISGVLTLFVNLAAIWFFVEIFDWDKTDFLRNAAHLAGNEISILFSFHLHNYFTWKGDSSRYLKKIVQFHAITLFTIFLRQVGFFFLDQWGFHWLVSTMLPLVVAIIINFTGYDKLVFKKASRI
jgi:putative flippase GtrA